MHRVSVREAAEDLVQDTFMVACQRWETFERKSEVRTWLFGILKNKIADHYRAAYRLPTTAIVSDPYFDDSGNWEAEQRPSEWKEQDENHLLDDASFRTVFEDCKDKLPAKWHHSLLLKYLEEKESEAICQEVGISTTNYWQMLHRAKLQLRKCLELNWFTL